MNIDLIPNGSIKRVHVSQNDVGRTLTFELFNNSTSYTVPSGAVVKIQGTKPSGFGFSETCAVNGNTVTVDTTETMTDEFGYIDTELQITDSGDVIGTSNFILAIEKNPHPDNTTDGTQITAQSLEVRIEALEESALGGLTDEAKQALLNCFAHVAWIDEDGQDYYDALEDALYPPATLTSISAVYTQSGTVYDTDSLDDLKADLVVTAHYDNGTTQTITNYTLSGTLTEGTSTITVTYSGKTTTFNVTVTADYVRNGLIHHWDAIDNTDNGHDSSATTWIDLVGDLDLSQVLGGTWESNALLFSPSGSTDKQSWISGTALDNSDAMTIEVVLKPTTDTSGVVGFFKGYGRNLNRCISMASADHSVGGFANESSNGFATTELASLTSLNSIVATYTDQASASGIYVNGEEKTKNVTHSYGASSVNKIYLGGYGALASNATYPFYGKIHAVRIYNRVLTAQEIATNYSLDVARFGLGA